MVHRDGRKINFWVYMLPLISFVNKKSLNCINQDAKVHDFINDFKLIVKFFFLPFNKRIVIIMWKIWSERGIGEDRRRL